MTVIGLGSPFGDDRVGWRVVELLSRRLAPALARVLPLDRPGPALLEALGGRAEAVLIDGAATGRPLGSIHRLCAAEVAASGARTDSGHGLGLAETLQLGRALGILPPRLTVYVVSIDPTDTVHPDARLTKEVEAAAVRLARELEQELTHR
ncbi:MAG: hydrogenase maturation protease [Chromatiaceae bacterium]|nr:hydrogenase maturation protease [Chromatiaceae bacterium]